MTDRVFLFSAGGGGGAGEGDASAGVATDYKTEYAKSGKSTCRGCDDKIGKACNIPALL